MILQHVLTILTLCGQCFVLTAPLQILTKISALSQGRHTVMTDVNAIDPYTYGGLPCVCPGDLASVRLGDNINGARQNLLLILITLTL